MFQWTRAVDKTLSSQLSCLKLATGCCFAAVIVTSSQDQCGSTGIAGGMVLAPLFMSYDMLPEVLRSF